MRAGCGRFLAVRPKRFDSARVRRGFDSPRPAILLAVLALAGCSTVSNTCGAPPRELANYLSGEEYVTRARAWESFGTCLFELIGPEPPVEVPIVEPDLRKVPSPDPWAPLNPRPKRQPQAGERQARHVPERRAPTGAGPAIPAGAACYVKACRERLRPPDVPRRSA